MKKITLLICLVFLVSTTLSAQTKCSVWADVVDKDPEGTNIRSGAGKDYPALIKMPRARSIVFISGMKGAWSRITTYSQPYDNNKGVKWSDDRGGWIATSLLALYTKVPLTERFGYLRAKPDDNSLPLEKITG